MSDEIPAPAKPAGGPEEKEVEKKEELELDADGLPKNKFTKSGKIRFCSTVKKHTGKDGKPAPLTLNAPHNSWQIYPAKNFNVRKKGYMTDKSREKAPSEDALYDIQGVDFVSTAKTKLPHVARFFEFKENDPVPGYGKTHHLPSTITLTIIIHEKPCSLFKSTEDGPSSHMFCVGYLSEKARAEAKEGKLSPALKLFSDFVKNDFKGNHDKGNSLKMITRLGNADEFAEECGFVLRGLLKNFNGVPYLIWKCARYFKTSDNRVDIEVDVHKFRKTSKKGVDNFRGEIGKMIVDIAAIIEGRCDEHLPECVLMCARANHLNIESVTKFPEANQAKLEKELPKHKDMYAFPLKE